jgi:hypothetical protein
MTYAAAQHLQSLRRRVDFFLSTSRAMIALTSGDLQNALPFELPESCRQARPL